MCQDESTEVLYATNDQKRAPAGTTTVGEESTTANLKLNQQDDAVTSNESSPVLSLKKHERAVQRQRTGVAATATATDREYQIHMVNEEDDGSHEARGVITQRIPAYENLLRSNMTT